jgi:hypothetical protein
LIIVFHHRLIFQVAPLEEDGTVGDAVECVPAGGLAALRLEASKGEAATGTLGRLRKNVLYEVRAGVYCMYCHVHVLHVLGYCRVYCCTAVVYWCSAFCEVCLAGGVFVLT